jgi:hypothetical protein
VLLEILSKGVDEVLAAASARRDGCQHLRCRPFRLSGS